MTGACIVGIGETEYRRWGGFPDRSEFDLACEAIMNAAADAGLPHRKIDGFTSFNDDANHPSLLQVALGTEEVRFAALTFGGGGGGSAGCVALAAAAVDSGQADYVVAFRSLCQGQAQRYGRSRPKRTHGNFVHPFGLFAPPQMAALVVRRYMEEYGVTADQMAEIALVCRDNATRNPRAVMGRRPMTREDYFASRMIADPLRLFDCCLETDGACAVIVTSLERARDLKKKPVRILAAAQGCEPLTGSSMLGSHNMPAERYAGVNARTLAQRLFADAGLTPADIDVLQVYDHFTGLVLIAFEEFGFCGRGEGGAFAAAGNLRWPNGSLPINTHGGNLSEAYVIGFNHVVEGVRQLRGESTSPVEGAETCLVTGGLAAAPTSALILGA